MAGRRTLLDVACGAAAHAADLRNDYAYEGPEADTLARSATLPDLLAYADAVHQTIVTWLATLRDDDLDARPDVPAHIARYAPYLSDTMRAEVPWMYEQPPLWRCLSPGLGHVREHLAEIDLLKRQLRLRA